MNGTICYVWLKAQFSFFLSLAAADLFQTWNWEAHRGSRRLIFFAICVLFIFNWCYFFSWGFRISVDCCLFVLSKVWDFFKAIEGNFARGIEADGHGAMHRCICGGGPAACICMAGARNVNVRCVPISVDQLIDACACAYASMHHDVLLVGFTCMDYNIPREFKRL